MRGNENQTFEGDTEGLGGFPIPMRGNEESGARRLALSIKFPIPMRGNELGNVWASAAGALKQVPNPHEG